VSDFLTRILATKEQEVRALQDKTELRRPQQRPRKPRFAHAVMQGEVLSVVAEVKKASPSKGLIQAHFNPVEIARQYESLDVAAISVLTDETYFQGSMGHLQAIAEEVPVPLLRKDFIIHETQIHEAVLAGADAVLLIVAALSPDRLRYLSAYAKDCGLDVLIEIHSVSELKTALAAHPSVLGINNRDLTTFKVDLTCTETIMPYVPETLPVISESGIASAEDASRMGNAGVSGLLVGESLMRRSMRLDELRTLLRQLQVPREQRQPKLALGECL